MEQQKILYWTGFDRYENCPQQYLWYYGWPGIDVGGGPGKKKPVPKQRSEHHLLMGTVIQAVVEWMYLTEAWKNPVTLRSSARETLDKRFERELARRFVDWHEVTRQEIYDICLSGVMGYLDTMVANRLVGDVMRPEIEFIGCLKQDSYPIAVRADLVIVRKNTNVLPGVTVLDGKNSKHKDKYTNPDQLRWTALCHYLRQGTLPDRLGWCYYRYPAGTPIPGTDQVETGIDWVSYTLDEVKGLAARAIEAHDGLLAQNFDPHPVPKVCKFCDYEPVCEARQTTKRRRKPKPSLFGDGEDWSPREVEIEGEPE